MVDGASLPVYADGIRRVYADVFSAPPWNEGPAAASAYVRRLAADAERPGFTAALRLAPDTAVRGFATAWTTPATFPSGRSYGHVAQALGPERLCDVPVTAAGGEGGGRGPGGGESSDGRIPVSYTHLTLPTN